MLAGALFALGRVEQASGRKDEARAILTRAQTIARAQLPEVAPLRAQIDRDLFWLSSTSPFAPVPGPGQEGLDAALRTLPEEERTPARYHAALRRALEQAELTKDKPNAARAALLLGSALGERGDWVEAQRLLERRRGFAEQAGDRGLTAEAYRLLGSALLQVFAYEMASPSRSRRDNTGLSLRWTRSTSATHERCSIS